MALNDAIANQAVKGHNFSGTTGSTGFITFDALSTERIAPIAALDSSNNFYEFRSSATGKWAAIVKDSTGENILKNTSVSGVVLYLRMYQ